MSAAREYMILWCKGDASSDMPDAEVVVDPDNYQNGEIEGCAEDTHVAAEGETGGKYGLVHENKTPCDAHRIEDCPQEKKSEKADRLGGGRRKIVSVETLRIHRKRLTDPEYAAAYARRRALYRERDRAKEAGDTETVQACMAELEAMNHERLSSQRDKSRYQQRREHESTLPAEEQMARQRLKTLNMRLRNALDPEKIEELTKERDTMRKTLDRLMDERGCRIHHGELPHKTKALHSEEWNRIQNRIKELSSKAKFAAGDASRTGEMLTPEEQSELKKLQKDFIAEGAREKKELDDNEKRGIVEYREYLGWGRRIVVRWHNGRWTMAKDRMDPQDVSYVLSKMIPKRKALTQAQKDRIREKGTALAQRRRAKAIGVSERFFRVVGPQFMEATGLKVVAAKQFLDWCRSEGIRIETWEQGLAREYLEKVGKDGSKQ